MNKRKMNPHYSAPSAGYDTRGWRTAASALGEHLQFLNVQVPTGPEHTIDPQSLDIIESRAHGNFFAGIKYAYMPTHKERGELTGVRLSLPEVDNYLVTTFDTDETANDAV